MCVRVCVCVFVCSDQFIVWCAGVRVCIINKERFLFPILRLFRSTLSVLSSADARRRNKKGNEYEGLEGREVNPLHKHRPEAVTQYSLLCGRRAQAQLTELISVVHL